MAFFVDIVLCFLLKSSNIKNYTLIILSDFNALYSLLNLNFVVGFQTDILKFASEALQFDLVLLGIPRSKRGEVWLYLAERHCAQTPPFDCSNFPNYNAHYEDLLKQLTSQQHAILIDLGNPLSMEVSF
jgi:hypothetical protein